MRIRSHSIELKELIGEHYGDTCDQQQLGTSPKSGREQAKTDEEEKQKAN